MSHFHVTAVDLDGQKRRYAVGDMIGAEKEARYEREAGRTDVSVETCSEDCIGKRLV